MLGKKTNRSILSLSFLLSMYVKKTRERVRETRASNIDRNDVGQMIKELNHAMQKKKKMRTMRNI
jgi:hypothetical protein